MRRRDIRIRFCIPNGLPDRKLLLCVAVRATTASGAATLEECQVNAVVRAPLESHSCAF